MQKSDKLFLLLIDEERAELMQVMFTCLYHQWEDFCEHVPDRAEVLRPVLKEYLKEFSNKMHEVGWCKDPDCDEHKS